VLIAISGVSGFIGSHLARTVLDRGWDCIGLIHHREAEATSNKRFKCLRLHGSTELRFQQLSEYKIDAIVHCATRYVFHHSRGDIDEMLAANVGAGIPLLEYASASNAIFVNLSSVFQHGPGLPYSPNSLYAATKQAFSDLAVHYSQNCGLSAIDLCLHDTYGPGDRRKKLIPHLVEAIREKREITLGSPDTHLNLLYVDDVTRAILTSIEDKRLGFFSAVANEDNTIGQVISALEKLTGRHLQVKFDESLTRDSTFPRPVAPRLPGWKPEIDLQRGLAEVLAQGQR
jgi:nucleoside-diphosphate-sugar epimerase